MENLNKENFWNDLQKKHPNAVKEFCDWIDKYKESVNWTHVFNTSHKRDFKFHHLPFDMQTGIILRFIEEKEGVFSLEEYRNYMVSNITNYFEQREAESNG